MKVFWWQNGLHFEPETDEERKALAMLLDSAKVESLARLGTGVLGEQSAKSVVSDAQSSPRN